MGPRSQSEIDHVTHYSVSKLLPRGKRPQRTYILKRWQVAAGLCPKWVLGLQVPLCPVSPKRRRNLPDKSLALMGTSYGQMAASRLAKL